MIRACLVAGCVLVAAVAWCRTAEWPMFRSDGVQSARAGGSGAITNPQVTWSFDLRGWTVQLGVAGDPALTAPQRRDVRLAGEASPPLSATQQAAWGLTQPMVDLAGDGKRVPAPAYAAKVLPDVPGYQVPGTVMTDAERGRCVLYAYDGGRQREVWRSEEFRVYQGPHPVVVDANGDGKLEVVACPHYQIVVLDGETGEVIQQLRWHDGRNYGHFIAKDIDGDGATEFLVLADFYTHMDMVDNDGTDLKLLWRKEIELHIENKQKILRPRWDSLQDLDGDGRFEVVTNLYNDTGDKQWHVMVYDALTGQTVCDLSGMFMSGLEDVDGDGRVELFCCATTGLFEPTSAPLSIIALTPGQALAEGARVLQPVRRYARPSGAWVVAPRRCPLYMSSLVAHGEDNIVTAPAGAGARAVYVTEPAAESGAGPVLRRLVLRGASDAGATPFQVDDEWALTAPADCRTVRVVSHEQRPGSAAALVALEAFSPEGLAVTTSQCRVRPVTWRRSKPVAASWGNLVAADLDGSGQATVVSVAAASHVVAVTPPRDPAAAPRLRWRRLGAPTLAAADLVGDGRRHVALLGWQPSGEGAAVVLKADGEVRWSRPMAGFPGPMEPWNYGTLTVLATGKLSGAKHDDLIVFARRSTMHSDEGFALNGPDGNLLWHRDTSFDGHVTWEFGGTPVALTDTNGDGCDDIISLYPVNLTVVSGKDGTQLVGRSGATGEIFPGVWEAYGLPTVWDLDGDGQQELVWNSPYGLGVSDLQGNGRWCLPPADGFPIAAGDGTYQLVSSREGMLRWIEPVRGDIVQTLTLPAQASSLAIADIDGDGIEEAVLACGKHLVAAHVKDGQPSIVWSLETPTTFSEFILADTDGDGRLEVVLLGGDGRLYGVDG